MRPSYSLAVAAVCAALGVQGCASNGRAEAQRASAASAAQARGAVVSVEPLGVMDQARLQAIAAEFPGAIKVQQGARLFRVVYWTELKGRPVQASGLLAAPLADGPVKGVVMYLHGTTLTRALAPSQPDRVDGNEETAVFAGNGYAVVLPDYLGLGVSQGVQQYLIARPQVDASVDLLRAARTVAAQQRLGWSSSLYLMGFSQGGHTLAAVQRELERRPLPDTTVRGSVAIAGAYDLRPLPRGKLGPGPSSRLENIGYVALTTLAYALHDGQPLDQVFTPEWAAKLPVLLDGDHSLEQIASGLPDDARKLFQPAFLQRLQADEDSWFTKALDRNETYRWSPRAPIRLYYGEADLDVPPVAHEALARAPGGRVTAQSLGPVDHQDSAALAYAPTLAWFDELASGQ